MTDSRTIGLLACLVVAGCGPRLKPAPPSPGNFPADQPIAIPTFEFVTPASGATSGPGEPIEFAVRLTSSERFRPPRKIGIQFRRGNRYWSYKLIPIDGPPVADDYLEAGRYEYSGTIAPPPRSGRYELQAFVYLYRNNPPPTGFQPPDVKTVELKAEIPVEVRAR